MAKRPDIHALAEEAKRKGYFATDDFPGVTFTQEDLSALLVLLKKRGVPFGRPTRDNAPLSRLSQGEALAIVKALRLGAPATEYIEYYSAGRESLLNQVAANLDAVTSGQSHVRLLNADIGQGKTHTLYQLRGLAFQHDFAVSIVTLSQNSCPLYDFMTVYHEIMWGLRTSDQRHQPALSNIIDRWVDQVRGLGRARVTHIVENELPATIRQIMATYVDATNMMRPDEAKRLAVLKYLSGEKMFIRDIRRLNLPPRIDSNNALQILSEIAAAIRHIGFKGVCILFDEVEAIHSFAYSQHRDQAFANIQQIIGQSGDFSHCYLVYATTPSFFASGASRSIVRRVGGKASILELNDLTVDERQSIGERISKIYTIATSWRIPDGVTKAIDKAAEVTQTVRVGDYVRQAVAILDEKRQQE